MTLEELNQAVEDGSIYEMALVAEAAQVKALGRIADDICSRKEVRLVLLAGASSAGKTTTCLRLCTQLRVNGRKALHLSTDDYFVGDELNPRDANGNLDYEHVECVDIARLVEDLNALIRGKTIAERRFDFLRHRGYDSERTLSIPKDGIIVLEGIHALNPRLSKGVRNALKYRLFVEPRPNVEIFAGAPMYGEEARFLRRLVRDNRFRKLDPAKTIRLWPNVLAGERKWINPFRPLADSVFNSYLSYELPVLKLFAEGLLVRAQRDLGDLPEINRMLELLAAVVPLGNDIVPSDSILRETIGGSILQY